jgi:serine/threonine-protein kinase
MATELLGGPRGPAGVREGDLLAGKYRIEKILGAGGMGVVVAAHHIQLDEKVAIKFLLPEALGSPEAVARFAREARAAVKIKSEHVARVIDVGTLDTGAPYMVMEYLDGADLAARLRQRGPLSVDDAVTFSLQTCEALADAHALGIIHRDLKPANLFVTRRTDGTDCIKVLDFGISKLTSPAVGSSNMAMTRTSALMGSPIYMSPEQMASARNVDVRSDIWALGVTLYELLAGVPPFAGETITELCTKVLTAPTPKVRDRRPEVPEALELVIDRCLEKDPGKRFPNVAALAIALAELGPRRSRQSAERISRVLAAAGLSSSALQLPPSTDPSPQTPAQTAPSTLASWGQTKTRTTKHRTLVAGLAVVGVLAAASVVVVVKLGGSPITAAAPQPSSAASAMESVGALAPSHVTRSTEEIRTPGSARPTIEPAVSASPSADVSPRATPREARTPTAGQMKKNLRAEPGKGATSVSQVAPSQAPTTAATAEPPRSPSGVTQFGSRK